MIALFLGIATLLVMMAALGMFSRAQVATIKSFGVWFLAIGGLALAGLLFLTGRGGVAIAALAMLGPSVWAWMRPRVGSGRAGSTNPQSGRTGGIRGGSGMTRDEALQVLGLSSGVNRVEIQAAYVRLMRTAHPDGGGSDWLAARINQARDTLLG